MLEAVTVHKVSCLRRQCTEKKAKQSQQEVSLDKKK